MELTTKDKEDIALAHTIRVKLIPPRQSSFRVVAIIYYTLLTDTDIPTASTKQEEEEHYVVGANDEPCYMNGSICAERAALNQLRFVPLLNEITRIIIVTDSSEPIFPGFLCREFMIGQWNNNKCRKRGSKRCIDPNVMPIICAGSVCSDCDLNTAASIIVEEENGGCDDDMVKQITKGCHQDYHNWKTIKMTLNELYPHPSPYTYLTGRESGILGKKRLKRVFRLSLPSSSPSITEEICQHLIQRATEAAQLGNDREELHPIQYGAAVLFDNKDICTGYQRKCLEYGCSQDAVFQLSPSMEERSKRSPIPVSPLLLVQTDQYGVVHTPFASARAYLSEFGYGKCGVLVSKHHCSRPSSSSSSHRHNDENHNDETYHPKNEEEEEWYEITVESVDGIAPSAPDIANLHPTEES